MKLISSKLIKKMSVTNKNKKENNFGCPLMVDIVVDIVVGFKDVVVRGIQNDINFKK